MKTTAQNGKHGRCIVWGKEVFLEVTLKSVGEEGEVHSMERDQRHTSRGNKERRVWCQETGGRECQRQSGECGIPVDQYVMQKNSYQAAAPNASQKRDAKQQGLQKRTELREQLNPT